MLLLGYKNFFLGAKNFLGYQNFFGVFCQIQLCIPAMHDTFQFGVIVPSSYDEYTALVKSGNVASKHVNGWRVRSKRQICNCRGSGTNVQEL